MMLASAALLTLPHLLGMAAPAAPAFALPADGDAYWAVVTGSAVNVRSGPSAQSAYAFGKLKTGDLVRVVREEYGWARVSAEGNAFSGIAVFVPADRRVTLSADGATATVSSRTELRAPNLDAGGSPDKSWKQVGNADAGTTLTVLETVKGEKESVYKVKAPATAEAWVNMQFLRKATDAEAASATAAPATAAATATGRPEAAPQPSATPAPVAVDAAAPATEQAANADPSGAPAPAPVATAPEIGTSPSLSSPAIPPLLGEKPQNAAVTNPQPVTVETRTETRTTRTVPLSKRATLDELERQFQAVRAQPQAEAEFDALRAKYEELAATTTGSGGMKGLADARAQQLSMMSQVQREVQLLERTRSATTENKKGIAELILNIQRRADYTAIGILNASAVYDGERLPLLYRICDPMTGATIAYVEPNPDIALATMLGTLVGVKGGKSTDPALHVTVISPIAADLLTQRTEPQVTKTEATRPIEAAGTFVPATATEAAPEAAPCPDEKVPESFMPAPNATP